MGIFLKWLVIYSVLVMSSFTMSIAQTGMDIDQEARDTVSRLVCLRQELTGPIDAQCKEVEKRIEERRQLKAKDQAERGRRFWQGVKERDAQESKRLRDKQAQTDKLVAEAMREPGVSYCDALAGTVTELLDPEGRGNGTKWEDGSPSWKRGCDPNIVGAGRFCASMSAVVTFIAQLRDEGTPMKETLRLVQKFHPWIGWAHTQEASAMILVVYNNHATPEQLEMVCLATH